MQLVGGLTAKPDYRRFSIHKRIEGGATVAALATSTPASSFSIHKRIEGGATGVLAGWAGLAGLFQYPQADRRGCNWAGLPVLGVLGVRFSIHKRIEGGATGGFADPPT